MKRPQFNNFKQWDDWYQRAIQRFDELKEPELLQRAIGEVVDLYEIEQTQMEMGPVDKELTEIFCITDSLRSTMLYWRDLAKAKFRMYSCTKTNEYPASDDRKEFVNYKLRPFEERLTAARTTNDVVKAKKRFYQRQDERLVNLGHNVRKSMP